MPDCQKTYRSTLRCKSNGRQALDDYSEKKAKSLKGSNSYIKSAILESEVNT